MSNSRAFAGPLERALLCACSFALLVGTGCSSSTPATTQETPGATTAAAPAVPPAPAEPLEPEVTGNVPEATMVTSSVLDAALSADGLLRAKNPGWHSRNPPMYPEWIEVQFKEPQHISGVSLLPQHQHSERSPGQFDVQTSGDGKKWTTAVSVENGCEGEKGRWRSYALTTPVTTQWVRLQIRGNCGERTLVTLRGLRFE